MVFCDERVKSVIEELQLKLSAEQFAALFAIDGFTAVLDASDYVSQQLLRHAADMLQMSFTALVQQQFEAGQMRSLLRDHLQQVTDEVSLSVCLRQFRRLHMVRIIWRDITRMAGLDETLEDLSELADVCVDESLQRLYAWAVAKNGTPRDESGNTQELIVIGMGKLGARELNLSSDIDLIFAYPERGQTDADKPVDTEKFFTRLARQLIKAIGENTAQGFVFRVDTRLRPFGDAGPLVIPMSFLEDYLQGQAREWERYAMVKARIISGSQACVDEFQALIKPFVYRRYLDYGAIESIRDMKKLIKNEMYHRGMDANIKLGMGGIREIEFIGQAFQLIRGGREPDLQIRPIQSVLKVLGEKEILSAQEVDELLSAYEFLRLTENRLQAWKDEQTHVLPADAGARERLAKSMDFADWDTFNAKLGEHRHTVQLCFDDVFAAPQVENGQQHALADIWQEGIDDARAVAILNDAGFSDPEMVWRRLQDFRHSSACQYMRENGRRRLAQLMPVLLETVARNANADQLLARIIPLLENVSRRTAYLALMVENPQVIDQLARLMGQSEWIAEQIRKYPLLMDEMIDQRNLFQPLKKQQLTQELQASLLNAGDDEEQLMERMRQFMQANMLRVAAADLTGAIPVNVVSDYLSDIAEVLCQAVLDSSFGFMQKKHGQPQQTLGHESGFAIIAYGKLGGLELGYSSDLDVVFVHDSQSASAMTDGAKPLANDVFYARLVKRMITEFTTRMASGQLYEIDMRLRPNGNSGLLISSLAAFERYQLEDAWTWEHQALIRARAVAGDPLTIAGFEALRRRILTVRRDPLKLQQDVRDMREKMRQSLDKSDDAHFDLKQGVGGIADIEFMVQYAVLRWAVDYPDLLDWTDNARLLETLAAHDLLTRQDFENLLAAYWAYRADYHHLSLQKRKGLVDPVQFARQRQQVMAVWQRLMTDSP